MVATYSPQGFIVVLAVNDESSLELGERLLHFINLLEGKEKSVILVANKADLVKTRVIKPCGKLKIIELFSKSCLLVVKELAKKFNVKCFETSTGNYHLQTKEIFYKLLVGINHNKDELLVELTLQMKQKRLERFKRRRSSIRMVR